MEDEERNKRDEETENADYKEDKNDQSKNNTDKNDSKKKQEFCLHAAPKLSYLKVRVF